MRRQYVLSRSTSGTTVTSITSIFGTGNTTGVHEDCANDVSICRWCADDMQMTCVSADDMQMTLGVVLHEIGQLREVCRWHVDGMRMACGWHVCADDMQMMCRWCVDDMCVCRWHADDTRCSITWNWATQASVWMMSGWHMSSAGEISPEISLSCHLHVICTSSACCPHVVCKILQLSKYFQLNTRATALLKMKPIFPLPLPMWVPVEKRKYLES